MFLLQQRQDLFTAKLLPLVEAFFLCVVRQAIDIAIFAGATKGKVAGGGILLGSFNKMPCTRCQRPDKSSLLILE